MGYLGSWKVGDSLTFYAATHSASTGAATSADAAPVYRVYEDETSAALASGTMATLASANVTGFYSEQIALASATGYEKGKCYAIAKTAAVASVSAVEVDVFQIEAEVDANIVSDKTGYTSSVSAGGISSAAFVAGAINNAATSAGLISSATFAAGAINNAATATGFISSASFVAGAINAAAASADLTTEITAAVATSANLATVLSRIGTPSDLGGGASLSFNLSDIEAQTDDIGAAGAGLTTLATSANLATVLTRLGTPSDLGGGATVAANLSDIEAQTDDIPTLATSASIAALNNVSSAQVLTAASAALATYDPPTNAEMEARTISSASYATSAAVAALATSASLASLTTTVGAAGAGLTVLATSAALATLQTTGTAIKAKTDSLTFTVANQVDSNAVSMNDAEIIGDGTSGDLWRGA